MAQSSAVSSGELATATQYNNLRDDVLSVTTGHLHDGSNGRNDGAFNLNVAGLPLTLENTTDGVSNQILLLRGDNATRADNDEIYITLSMDDDGGNSTEFVRLSALATDVSDTTEDGQFDIDVMIAGTLTKVAHFNASGLDLAASDSLSVNGTNILADSAGTMTLSNIDALDATTEATIEAAIDTSANLTSIQGLTVTLADAGADAIFGWDDTASAYENLTAAEAVAVLSKTIAYTDLANGTDGELITWDASGVIAAVATGTSGQVLTSNGAGTAPTFQAAGSSLRSARFIAPHAVTGTGTTLSKIDSTTYAIAEGADSSAVQDIHFSGSVPSDATTLSRAVLFHYTGGSNANARISFNSEFGASGEGIAANTDSIAVATIALVTNQWLATDITAAFTALAANDAFGLRVRRDGTDGADTITTWRVAGILMEWT